MPIDAQLVDQGSHWRESQPGPAWVAWLGILDGHLGRATMLLACSTCPIPNRRTALVDKDPTSPTFCLLAIFGRIQTPISIRIKT
jgi:hypothetical protein